MPARPAQGRQQQSAPVQELNPFQRARVGPASATDIVARAFLLARKTGEVRVGKQGLGLSDHGAHLVADILAAAQLSDQSNTLGKDDEPVATLSICNHGITCEGARVLGTALMGHLYLQQLHLSHNAIGEAGANHLSEALVTVHHLRTLDLGNNRIGPAFPPALAKCTALTCLDLQHNALENVSIEIGNHPSLVRLELTGNGIIIPDADEIILHKATAEMNASGGMPPETRLHRERDSGTLQNLDCVPQAGRRVQENQERETDRCKNSGGLVNWSTTQLLKFLLDIKFNVINNERYRKNEGAHSEQDWIPSISNVSITLAERWNRNGWEIDYINQLLDKYTSLQSLNGLQEWPLPPLEASSEWNLAGKLRNPLYECHFVKNRLSARSHSVNITRLILDKNDLRGRAAEDIAKALICFQNLSDFSSQDCMWDDSIMALAGAARTCSHIQTVNGNTLRDEDKHWDLKGSILNSIDASFVVRMLVEKGSLGNLRSLDLRGNNLQRSSTLMIAKALSYVSNLEEVNVIRLSDPPDNTQGPEQAHADDQQFSRSKRKNTGIESCATGILSESEQSERNQEQANLSQMSEDSALSLEPVVETETLNLRKRLLNGRVENGENGKAWSTLGSLHIELTFLSLRIRDRPQMVDLNFSENKMGDDDISCLCDIILGLKVSLEKLHLTQNQITENGATELGRALAHVRNLRVLRLSSNPLSSRGAGAILQGLVVHPTLEQLYLEETNSGPFLPEDLYKLTNLHFLSIKNNDVIGISIDFLKLTSLSTFWYDGNPIEFPPDPIPRRGWKGMRKWLQESRNACSDENEGLQIFRSHSKSSSLKSEDFDDLTAARLARESTASSVQQKHRNDLWVKLAERFGGKGEKESENEQKEENSKVRVQCRLYRHGQQVTGLTFHPLIPLMASGSVDRTVKIWERNPDLVDNDIWTCSHTLKGHSNAVTCVTFTGCSQHLMLAALSSDGIIRLWLPEKDPFGENYVWTCGQILGNKPSEAHHGAVHSLAFSPQGVKLMLASGGEDNKIKIWGPTPKFMQKTAEDVAVSGIVPLDDSRLDHLRDCFHSFARGEIPGVKTTESEKRLAGRGKRAISMDMTEFKEFCRWSGLADTVSKTLLSSTFRKVSNHAKADDDRHEFTFEEFCELLFRISKKAHIEPPEGGKPFVVNRITWGRDGMISRILDVEPDLLSRWADNEGLEEVQGDLGWVCLFTVVDAHLGSVTELAWLPSDNEPVLASVGHDDRIKMWSYSENLRGRSQVNCTNNLKPHQARIHGISFVHDRSRADSRVVAVSSDVDNVIILWKVETIMQMKNSLSGQELVRQWLLKKGQIIEVPTGICITCTQLRSDAKVLAAGCLDGALLMWRETDDEGTYLLAERFECHAGIVQNIRFGGLEAFEICATAAQDGKCCLLDTSKLELIVPHIGQNDLDCKQTSLKKTPSAGPTGASGTIETLRRKDSLSTSTKILAVNSSVCENADSPLAVAIDKSILPPRLETRTFEVRKVAPWSVYVAPAKMEHLERRLASSTKSIENDMATNFPGHVELRSQEASPVYAMELTWAVNSVWYRTRAKMTVISTEEADDDLFPGMEIVSPVVDISPKHLTFRTSVKVTIPHHSATTDKLVLMHCADASPKDPHVKESKTRMPAVWEPVPCTVSETHVEAAMGRINGPLVVVNTSVGASDGCVAHRVYAIPLAADGRPIMLTGGYFHAHLQRQTQERQGLQLNIGEQWQGLIEVIPVSSVRALTALTSGFLDQFPFLPVYTLTKGVRICKLEMHCKTTGADFELRATNLAPGSWKYEGFHFIMGIELIAISSSESDSFSRPATGEPNLASQAPQRPTSRSSPKSASLWRPSTGKFASSIIRGRDESARSHDRTATYVLALVDEHGVDALRLKPFRVIARRPTLKIFAKWGNSMQARSLQIPISPGSTISQLREQVVSDLLRGEDEIEMQRSLSSSSTMMGGGKIAHDRARPSKAWNTKLGASGIPRIDSEAIRPHSSFSTNPVFREKEESSMTRVRRKRGGWGGAGNFPERDTYRPNTAVGSMSASTLSNLYFSNAMALGDRHPTSSRPRREFERGSVSALQRSVSANDSKLSRSSSFPSSVSTVSTSSGNRLLEVGRAAVPRPKTMQGLTKFSHFANMLPQEYELLPQEYEHVLPAATISRRGFGFFVSAGEVGEPKPGEGGR